MKDLSIAIVGAGIGGLTAALGLQRAGFRVRVYEQAPRLMQVGAGLSLSPTAAHGLRSIGMGPVLDEHGYAPEDQFIRSGQDGRVLMLTNRGRTLLERFGERYYLIHRADLHQGLAEAVRANDPAAICLDRRLVRIERTGNSVRLEFADASFEDAQALVAADGQRSIVRERLFGPGAPHIPG
jgi:2-polyprenyl-6-methoxyphenol hydroxylase-like FAD-dependent oxidoreductase